MGYAITINPDRGRVEIAYRGVVAPGDIWSAMDAMTSLPGWSPDMPRLIDWTDALIGDFQASEVSRDFLPEMEAKVKAIFGDRVSIIAHICADPLKRSLLEYWLALAGGVKQIEARLFDNVEAAEIWLDGKPWRRPETLYCAA